MVVVSKMADVVLLQSPPAKLEKLQISLFDSGAREFLLKLHQQFDQRIDHLYKNRQTRNVAVQRSLPPLDFKRSPERLDKSWTIAPLPSRLQNRHVDLGDVSASNSSHFITALNADVQAIQVDFDDGHCPTWKNQLVAFNNIMLAVHATHKLPGAPLNISTCPVLLLRPRAWNILEHNILIKGKEAPGALIDFGILMYHNAKKLYAAKSGPYFYLSKIEGTYEAQLWNDIFIWTQKELGLPQGTIKACVLIENIFSVFELDEILYALKDHSLGLNCGIWDYCASIIAKLGDRREYLLPDRNKYVNMSQHFLQSYVKLVVATCHARGAPATGGMHAATLPPAAGGGGDQQARAILGKVISDKSKEMNLGVDGFIVYDHRIVPTVNQLWKKYTATPNEIHRKFNYKISPKDLLTIPKGGVTLSGLGRNVAITIMFVYYWLDGAGHFFYTGAVEDSATAEISRWQVWQWVRFGAPLEDSKKEDNSPRTVTPRLVEKTAAEFMVNALKRLCRSNAERKRLTAARYMTMELFLARNPPEFITTYLNDNHKFRALNNKAIIKAHL